MDAIMVLATQFVYNTKRFSVAHKGGGGGSKKEGKAPSEIINLMTIGGPHQVMMKFKVAEVSRSIMKQFGINLASYSAGSPWIVGAVNGGASFPSAIDADELLTPIFGGGPLIGPAVSSFDPNVPAISASGLFASYLSGSNYLNLVIDASKNDGLAKILAEPTLTTMSGEPASFLSGGEFPVPVWGGSNQGIKVKFKEFGISVKAMPLVMDTGRIKLSLNISVSELTDAAGVASTIPGSNVALTIPSLSTRSASSTVELMDGQTMGIAGLISDKMRESITKFPGLGDIPVLGALFRSQSYINDKTELVMFVTAHLAKPIDPKKIRLPTEAYSDPSTAAFFLLGTMNSKKEPVRSNLQMTSVATNQPHKKKSDQVISSEPASKPEVDNSVPPEPADRPLTEGGPTFGHAL
jgi:pilus assembly protein CpaC